MSIRSKRLYQNWINELKKKIYWTDSYLDNIISINK